MLARICKKCGQEKSIDDFATDPKAKLGHDYRCKGCRIAYSKIYMKIKDRTPERMLKNELWRRSERGRHLCNLRRREDYATNTRKYHAKRLIERLVHGGIIAKQPCAKCGNENSVAHHPDYSKPLEIVWLCQLHHSEAHSSPYQE